MKAKLPIPTEMQRRIKELAAKEARQAILEADDKYLSDLDAIILWSVHVVFGAGERRLRRFWLRFGEEHERLHKRYELGDGVEDYAWICREHLKAIGVDIEAWQKGDIKDE